MNIELGLFWSQFFKTCCWPQYIKTFLWIFRQSFQPTKVFSQVLSITGAISVITIGLVVQQSETLSSGAKAKARRENYNGQPPIQKECGHEISQFNFRKYWRSSIRIVMFSLLFGISKETLVNLFSAGVQDMFLAEVWAEHSEINTTVCTYLLKLILPLKP